MAQNTRPPKHLRLELIMDCLETAVQTTHPTHPLQNMNSVVIIFLNVTRWQCYSLSLTVPSRSMASTVYYSCRTDNHVHCEWRHRPQQECSMWTAFWPAADSPAALWTVFWLVADSPATLWTVFWPVTDSLAALWTAFWPAADSPAALWTVFWLSGRQSGDSVNSVLTGVTCSNCLPVATLMNSPFLTVQNYPTLRYKGQRPLSFSPLPLDTPVPPAHDHHLPFYFCPLNKKETVKWLMWFKAF